jgi:XTP/dITP diphosphohydrolase
MSRIPDVGNRERFEFRALSVFNRRMSKHRLLIATTNAGKVKEIRHELEVAGLIGDFDVVGLKDLAGAYTDCVEDRPTFIGNATKKARHFAKLAGCLTLADDSGLCVDALNGAPGVYSARYAGVSGHGADAANNAKLLDALKDVPDDKRHAQFVCSMALATPYADLAVMVDQVAGVLLREPRGDNGFGYDPLFYFPQFKRTTAELDMQSKSKISHRGKALRRMIGWMRENETRLLAVAP